VAFAFCIFDEVREVEELLQSLTRCPDVLETRRQPSLYFQWLRFSVGSYLPPINFMTHQVLPKTINVRPMW